MHGPLQYTLDPRRIVTFLGTIAGVLLLLNMISAYAWAEGDFLFLTERDWVSYKYVEMFDLDEEKSFGTWFAAVILLFSGRLLLLVTHDSRRAQDGVWGWWLVLAIGFHFLSVDEVAGVHEYFNSYSDDFGWGDAKWTTYAFVLVLIVFASYLPFLILMVQKGRLRTVSLLVLAGVVYLGGGARHREDEPR